MRSFKADLTLRDRRLLDYQKEDRGPWSVAIQSIWPNFAVQRQSNTLAVRELIPNGPHEFYLYWTFFGYDGDPPELTSHRVRQANLMGPAGFVGLDDGEVIEFVQSGLRKTSAAVGIMRLGGDEMGTTDHYITEAALRSMYAHYREAMRL
jgi:anthranilate 1,2-dioxygenase large subunit